MTPHEILWDLPLARGRQLETLWWNIYFDRSGERGVECQLSNAPKTRNEEAKRILG